MNEGLTLNSAVTDTSSYTIEFRVRIEDSVSGWNKFVDFKNRTSDSGLYTLNGEVRFFPVANGGGSLTTGVDYTIGLERSAAGVVRVFLDYRELFSFNDTSSLAVPTSNILHFFIDDQTVTGEAFAGSVDLIRIHDDASTFGQSPAAVPEPISAAVWGTGLVAGVIARRRSRSKK